MGKGLGLVEGVEGRYTKVVGCGSGIDRRRRSFEVERRRGPCRSCRVEWLLVAGALVGTDDGWALGTRRSSEGEERSVEEAGEGRTGHTLGARSLVSFEEVVRRWARLVVVEGTLEVSVPFSYAELELSYHSRCLSEELACMSAFVSSRPHSHWILTRIVASLARTLLWGRWKRHVACFDVGASK